MKLTISRCKPQQIAKVWSALLAALAIATAPAAFAQSALGAPTLTFVFEEIVTMGDTIRPGKTGVGERTLMHITGGTFEGPGDGKGIKGTILPGRDWQLTRADGCTVINADYMLKTDDGVLIHIVNSGPVCIPEAGQPFAPMRTVPVFEPPLGKYDWLAKSNFISTVESAEDMKVPAVRIRIYRVN